MRLLPPGVRHLQLGAAALSLAAGLCALLMVCDGTRAPHAAVHPVPLDKNVDAKKCLECHDDKTKHKFVHSAMQGGCLTCHEVRVNKDVTRVKLITATPSSLCLTCHADKRPRRTSKGRCILRRCGIA